MVESRSVTRAIETLEAREGHPRNRIVEKFLMGQVRTRGLSSGRSSASDIWHYMQERDIDVPDHIRYPIFWINLQLKSLIRNGSDLFEVVEIEGHRGGMNFAWCWKCDGRLDRL